MFFLILRWTAFLIMRWLRMGIIWVVLRLRVWVMRIVRWWASMRVVRIIFLLWWWIPALSMRIMRVIRWLGMRIVWIVGRLSMGIVRIITLVRVIVTWRWSSFNNYMAGISTVRVVMDFFDDVPRIMRIIRIFVHNNDFRALIMTVGIRVVNLDDMLWWATVMSSSSRDCLERSIVSH